MSNNQDKYVAPLSWRTRWVLRRNRILGSLKFQNWAAKTPVFRSIARRKAAGQFDLIAGFVYTQITFVFVDTGLLEFLRQQPRTIHHIARFLQLDGEAASRILRAGAALDLAESPQDDMWALGEVGAALSVNEAAMAMIRHHPLLYRDLSDPVGLLRRPTGAGTELADFWTYAPRHTAKDRSAQPYSELMTATQPMVWEQIIGRYPFGQHKRMLDVGGGSGAFLEAIGGTTRELALGLFDLPDVAPLARERFTGSKLEDRVTIHAGSFRDALFPTGYDLITLVRILHDHDDAVAKDLLGKICDSLPAGGKLLIVEPMAETHGAEKMGDAYFGLYLWAMGSGRPRSFAENAKMVKSVGFSSVSELSTPLPIVAKALVATK